MRERKREGERKRVMESDERDTSCKKKSFSKIFNAGYLKRDPMLKIYFIC